jgi:flavin reductase (DIM6/NTAB) family NADH-FMN oxidoreductase RutF
MTATSFTALSFAPASMLVCINRSSRTHSFITRSGGYAVNLLTTECLHIAEFCATSGGDKSLPAEWLNPTPAFAVPTLRQAVAAIDCTVTQIFDSGTHSIVVGQVRAVGLSKHRRTADPLIHYRGAFRHLNYHQETRLVEPLPITNHQITEVI